MATGAESRELTDAQIARLVECISGQHMEKIALAYMHISKTTVENIMYAHPGDTEAWSRKLILHWRNKNPDNSRQVG